MANTFFEFLEEERIRDERRQIEETDKVVTLLKNANRIWAAEQPVAMPVSKVVIKSKKVATEDDVTFGGIMGFLVGAIVMGIFCIVLFGANKLGVF